MTSASSLISRYFPTNERGEYEYDPSMPHSVRQLIRIVQAQEQVIQELQRDVEKLQHDVGVIQ